MDIREAAIECEKRWNTRPRCVLACAGYADEHWQIYCPDWAEFPVYTLIEGGELERHPDAVDNGL